MYKWQETVIWLKISELIISGGVSILKRVCEQTDIWNLLAKLKNVKKSVQYFALVFYYKYINWNFHTHGNSQKIVWKICKMVIVVFDDFASNFKHFCNSIVESMTCSVIHQWWP